MVHLWPFNHYPGAIPDNTSNEWWFCSVCISGLTAVIRLVLWCISAGLHTWPSASFRASPQSRVYSEWIHCLAMEIRWWRADRRSAIWLQSCELQVNPGTGLVEGMGQESSAQMVYSSRKRGTTLAAEEQWLTLSWWESECHRVVWFWAKKLNVDLIEASQQTFENMCLHNCIISCS